MKLEIFEKMDAPELRKYIEFLLWHYRVVDAFWFIYVTEHFDQSTAERINESVWARASSMAVKDLKTRFHIQDKGLKGMVQALSLYPWAILTGYKIQENPDEVILSVPSCPPQEARLRQGLGEFLCKNMHHGTFSNIAKEVDEHIRVECFFAPPDPHPDDMFCKWRFYLENDSS